MDSSVTLSTITWTVLGGNSFTNPLNIYNYRNNLPVQSTDVNCFTGAIKVTIISISVKGNSILDSYVLKYHMYIILLTIL